MILVLAEQKKGKIQKGTFEVLEVARRLREKWKGACAALVVGGSDEKELSLLGQGGVETVYWAKHSQLDRFCDEPAARLAARSPSPHATPPAALPPAGSAARAPRSW